MYLKENVTAKEKKESLVQIMNIEIMVENSHSWISKCQLIFS